MIKLLFMDVDGTLTDGKIYMGNEGEVFKAFDIKDGCGIHDLLPTNNIIPVIITARSSKIVENRCRELKIKHIFQGCKNKKQKIIDIAKEFNITPNREGVLEGVAYIGDDLIDLPCMKIAQVKGCPADSVKIIKEHSNFVSQYNGGNGAVREFIEWIIDYNNHIILIGKEG